MSTPTLTKRRHGQRSRRYGMFRAKRRDHQRIHPRQTTRRHNSLLTSTTHQAPITAGAVPARVKRATGRMVTFTVTSTLAGASKARLGPWVSRVQAEHRYLSTRTTFFSPLHHLFFFARKARHTITPTHSGRSLLLFLLLLLLLYLHLHLLLHFKNLGSIGQSGVLRDV